MQLIWCNIIIAINASIMKYKAHVSFNYQNWFIEIVFISHVTQKSAEKWNMMQFEQTLSAKSVCCEIAPVCGRRAISTNILSAENTSRRARRCCLLPQCAAGLRGNDIHKYRYRRSSSSTFSVSSEYYIS